MKCPNCSALCMPTDPVCFACRRPLGAGGGSGPRGKPNQVVPVLVVAGCVVGSQLAREIGGSLLSAQPADGLDATAVGLAAVGGGVGAVIAVMLGRIITRLTGRRRGPTGESTTN